MRLARDVYEMRHIARTFVLPSLLFRKAISFLFRDGLRNGIISLADQGVVSATNFLTGVIMGRVCTKEEFGLYTLGFSVVLFGINLQASLISTPYSVYSPRLKGEAEARYVGSTLLHQLGLSALVIGFLATVSVILSLGIGPKGVAEVLLALAMAIAFILMREYARRLFFARLKMKKALLMDFCVSVIQIGGLLLLVRGGFLLAKWAYLIIGSACGLVALSWLFLDRNNFRFSSAQVVSDLRRNWFLGKWLLLSNLTLIISIQVYPWLLAGLHGTGATGTLAACMGVLYVANPFILGMGNFLGPETAHAFARGGVNELRCVVYKTTIIFAVIMGSFCLAMLFCGDLVISFFYGSKYTGNGLVISILALSQLALTLTFPVNFGLLAMERPDVGFKSYLLAMIITFTLGLRLVNSMGPLGAASGLLAGNLVASTFRWIVYKRQFHDPFKGEISS